jgi:outer membrane protein
MPGHPKARFLLFVVLLACVGCVGTRSKDPPEPPAQPERIEGGAARTLAAPPPAGASARQVHLRAYRFGLDQAIEWALANNLSLMDSKDQVVRAKFNVRTAAAAFEVKVIPRADASVSGGSGTSDASRGAGIDFAKRTAIGTQVGVSGDTTKTGATHTTTVGFELTQPLLRGLGRTVNEDGVLDAEFSLLSSERSFIEFQESLVLSVVRGFYEIIRQREVLQLNERSAERTRRHLRAAQARERVGLASRIDVLRAEIQLRQAEDNLIAAQQAHGDAVDRFRILLGFGPEDDVEIDADLSYNEFEIDPATATLMAMTNRLDLARARNEIQQQQRNLKIAKNNTLPQLDLVFGYQQSGTGSGFSDSSDLSDSMWTFGLSTSTDIRRTAERMRHQQARLDVEATRRNYQLFKDIVVREVKDALRRLDKNRKRIVIQKSDVDHARQKQKLAQMKFDRGLADNFELIDAEEEIIRAQTNHISAVTDYIVSQVEVKKAIGTLIQRPARLLR